MMLAGLVGTDTLCPMISLLITVEVNPERVDDFARFITEEAADCVAKEPGCRQFTVSRSVDQPNVFTLAEFYDDMAALEAHRLTPHFLLFQERVKEFDLVVGKSVVLGEVIQG
jgi:autoinducer 2-degrading protein